MTKFSLYLPSEAKNATSPYLDRGNREYQANTNILVGTKCVLTRV